MYVWGDSWTQAKIHAECYDYLLETALKARELGVDISVKPQQSTYKVSKTAGKRQASGEAVGADSGKKERREREFSHVLLDIEGTTTPISFVKVWNWCIDLVVDMVRVRVSGSRAGSGSTLRILLLYP
jgi:hypothetical protein